MKNIFKLLTFGFLATIFFVACEKKVGDLPVYSNGTAVTLAASATTIAPAVADSDKVALTLTWSNPNYSVDSSTVKYVIEIDSTGRNFAKETTTTVIGTRSASFTAKQINNILLNYGFAYNTAYNIDVRITSSQGNNNEQLKSNTIVINFKTYLVPPKVAPPASGKLFLVGSATASGWSNPVAVPSQQFTKLDNTTYQGTFFLIGGNQYLLLPVNGDWSNKYAVADGTLAGLSAGGDFGYNGGNNAFNSNFPGPAKTGMYTIRVDFQKGKFTVTPVGTWGLMYVPGDYQGWTPATAPTLGSPKNDGSFDGYVNIPSGGTYQFKLNTTPDWSNSFGDGGGGTLSSSGGNMQFPGAGYYRIVANTTAKTWSATKTTWSLIGSFAASNWSTDIPMTYDAGSNTWSATITTAAGDQFKFRANSDWGINLGETNNTGSLSYNGDNIGDASKNYAIPAGSHKVTLYLGSSGYYTYYDQ
jgi:hypothetical protein